MNNYIPAPGMVLAEEKVMDLYGGLVLPRMSERQEYSSFIVIAVGRAVERCKPGDGLLVKGGAMIHPTPETVLNKSTLVLIQETDIVATFSVQNAQDA